MGNIRGGKEQKQNNRQRLGNSRNEFFLSFLFFPQTGGELMQGDKGLIIIIILIVTSISCIL